MILHASAVERTPPGVSTPLPDVLFLFFYFCFYFIPNTRLASNPSNPPTAGAKKAPHRMDLSTRQGRREQGQRIQQAVERAGISIEELAGRIGCSRALIYQYLSGSTLAQPDRLQQIATQCGVPLTFFYSETGQEIGGDTTSLPPAAQTAPELASPSSASSTIPASPVPAAIPDAVAAPALPAPDVTSRLNEGLRGLQELAQAQEGPPDYRALASTCERILSLASQIGDRDAQSRAQLDLGIALNKIGDFPRASDALDRAVALSIETGNTKREMQARQSLGRAMTMMGRTDEARIQFQRVTDDADFNGRWRGLLSLGSLYEQQGEYQQAMQRFDEAAILLEEGEANRLAEPDKIAVGLLYVNANRRNVYLSGGDLSESRRLAEKCLADAEALGIAEQNLEARLDLGWCDIYTGHWAQAQVGLTTMLQLARFVGDQQRETMARAALGMFLAAAGDFDAAVANGKDALAFALARGDRLTELYAHLVLTDAYTGPNGRVAEARYHANQALMVAVAARYTRAEIECRLRLARLQARVASVDELRDAANRALTLAQSLGARHLESLAHAWLSEGLRRILMQNSAQGAAPTDEALQEAEQQTETALTLADATGYTETYWRTYDTQAGLAILRGDVVRAEAKLRASVAVLEKLRSELLAADVPDTLLENEDCQDVYARLTQLILEDGRAQDATAFLEQVGWPPLTARFANLLRAAPTNAEE